jgi:hypothetical protein
MIKFTMTVTDGNKHEQISDSIDLSYQRALQLLRAMRAVMMFLTGREE